MLALVEAGMARQEAYVLVQRSAMRAWKGDGKFRDNLAADADVASRLSPEKSRRASISITRSRTCRRSSPALFRNRLERFERRLFGNAVPRFCVRLSGFSSCVARWSSRAV